MPSPPSGVLAASLTPFHSEGSLAPNLFARHVDWLLSHGCDGALLFGTTGEGLSLAIDERRDGLDALLSADVSPDQLLVGTGALALPDAAALTRAATDRGVAGVLVLPPFHYRSIKNEGVFRFYDQLIQRVGSSDLRLYFYHFPELSGVPIPFSIIQRLKVAYPGQIAGIKDSSGEWDHTEALCRDFPDLQVFTGTERLLLPTLQAGGAGCISATANVTASLAARVVSRWKTDEEASALQETLTDLRTAFGPLPTIAALKYVLSQLQDAPDWRAIRPPLVPLSEDERMSVQELAEDLRGTVELPGAKS